MVADFADMPGAGLSNGSSPGFNGSAAFFVRWEFYPKKFLGFAQLACLVILFKRFWIASNQFKVKIVKIISFDILS